MCQILYPVFLQYLCEASCFSSSTLIGLITHALKPIYPTGLKLDAGMNGDLLQSSNIEK